MPGTTHPGVSSQLSRKLDVDHYSTAINIYKLYICIFTCQFFIITEGHWSLLSINMDNIAIIETITVSTYQLLSTTLFIISLTVISAIVKHH